MDQDKQTMELPISPFAKYVGNLALLSDNHIECYVLDTNQRVLSLGAAVRAMTNIDAGNLGNYIGVKALKPFINAENVLGELIEFSIPGTQFKGKGLEARQFLNVCRAYVNALGTNSLTTERQKEIAIKCSVILSACADIGLEALIDEATGYQYERKEDELQVKLRLYIAEELRAWEKTFPDELWEQFGRLTNWSEPLKNRPKWWGKLVIELIYDTLDKDVAKYLRDNKPPTGVHWHRQLTDNIGVRALVSRCYEIIGMAKTCSNIQELKEQVNHHYKNAPIPLKMDEYLLELEKSKKLAKEQRSKFDNHLKTALEYKEAPVE